MSSNPFSLKEKTILITGASSGIGKSTAIESSKLGAKIILTGRNIQRLENVYHNLEGKGHICIPADLLSDDDLSLLIKQIPSIDGIVHSAGVMYTLPFPFINKEKLEEIMKINFMVPTLLTQKILKAKKINKYGSIVFLSSTSGVWNSAMANSIYSSTKGAINGLVKGMAIDLAPKKIRVNCVNPAMIETPLYSEDIISKEQFDEDKKKYPLGRYGKPEEVAYAIIYLLSDASSWSTGTNLLLDGGYTLL